MNVWAPILKLVKRDPLAFCDYQPLDENDLRTIVANLPPPGAGVYGNALRNMAHKPKAEYSSNGEKGPRFAQATILATRFDTDQECVDMKSQILPTTLIKSGNMPQIWPPRKLGCSRSSIRRRFVGRGVLCTRLFR